MLLFLGKGNSTRENFRASLVCIHIYMKKMFTIRHPRLPLQHKNYFELNSLEIHWMQKEGYLELSSNWEVEISEKWRLAQIPSLRKIYKRWKLATEVDLHKLYFVFSPKNKFLMVFSPLKPKIFPLSCHFSSLLFAMMRYKTNF